jgi:hypothetical protein
MKFAGGHVDVIIAPSIVQRILELHHRAASRGAGRAFIEAFREIVNRLRTNPNDFGEPTYRLPALKLQIRCAVVPPLIIHFGVN